MSDPVYYFLILICELDFAVMMMNQMIQRHVDWIRCPIHQGYFGRQDKV